MSYPLPYPKFRGFTPVTNLPLVGGKLYSYEIDTLVPKPLYSDPELTTPLTNPVILDTNGETTAYGDGAYDLVLTDSDDVQLWTSDNVDFDTAAASVINTSFEWVNEITTGITFLDVDSFSITGDYTSLFHVNRRVKIDLTATTYYGTVTSAVFGSGETTIVVVLDSGTLTDTIEAVSVGILDSLNDSIPRIVGFLGLDNIWTASNTFTEDLTVDADMEVTGSLTVDVDLEILGSVGIGVDLDVVGDVNIGGNEHIVGDLTVDGTITGSAAATQLDALGVGTTPGASGTITSTEEILAGGFVYAAEGFKQPGTGGETLKFIRGIVLAAGTLSEGSGFTSVRNSTGDYTVTFLTAFSDTPSFNANAVSAISGYYCRIISASTTQVRYVFTLNTSEADQIPVDTNHHFQVVGPA